MSRFLNRSYWLYLVAVRTLFCEETHKITLHSSRNHIVSHMTPAGLMRNATTPDSSEAIDEYFQME